jgi:imidazolonepropionase
MRRPLRTGKNTIWIYDMHKLKLIGPFRQLLTMDHLTGAGPLPDSQLEIIENAGILVKDGVIEATGPFRELKTLTQDIEQVDGAFTAMPGLVDAHTHICWAGTRAGDYAMRLAGSTYADIAGQGGGIWSTVSATRTAQRDELIRLTVQRADKLLAQGTTTLEVKSGYGLSLEGELKMLETIDHARQLTHANLVPTCLAAHMKPKDFDGSNREYLEFLVRELLPMVRSRNLSQRVDIFIEEGAFTADEGRYYLAKAKKLGFDLVVHACQFTSGGLHVACELGALSADHLETLTDEDIRLLATCTIIPVVLPGASLGLGGTFAPARRILDAGASLAIASDWNPGTAPMGNLLMQAAVMGMSEKLTMAETLAALTSRAATALRLSDCGIIRTGMKADFIAFQCSDYREILYNQGGLMPELIWCKGEQVML